MRIELPIRGLLQDSHLFGSLVLEDGRAEVTVCVPSECRLHPMVLAMVASIVDAATASAIPVIVECEGETPPFWTEMGLADVVAQSVTSEAVREGAGHHIRVQRISTQKELGNFVTDFVPLLHAPPEMAATAKYVLFELVRNVLEHAGSARGAFAAAEVGDSGEIMLGVVDAGIGVAQTIRRSHAAPSVEDAIKLAFMPGVSGTTSAFGGNDTNGGAGLFFMKAMASLSRREMVMITDSTMMRLEPQVSNTPEVHVGLDEDIVTWASYPSNLIGTAVGVDLLMDDTLGFKKLLADIGAVYHLNVKKRKTELRKARFT